MDPLTILIITGVASYGTRKAHDAFADHPPLKGRCSHCGASAKHDFVQSGMNWKKTGGVGLLLGAAGLGIGSFVCRNVYRCTRCKGQTLRCRLPGCSGMARSGDYYDDELCGGCVKGNDKSAMYEAFRDQKQLAKVKKILHGMQQDRDRLRALLDALEEDRQSDKQQIRDLTRLLRSKNAEIAVFEKQLRAAN